MQLSVIVHSGAGFWMAVASTDDRFRDDKKGGPILTEGALSSR